MATKFTLKNCAIACVLFMANTVFAQTAAVAPDTSKPKEAPLVIAGHVDAYYRYSTNGVAGKTSYSDAGKGFGFGMVNLQLSKDNGKVGFMADVMFGPRAEGTNYNYVGTNSSSQTLIKQLYVTYKPNDRARFTMGNFMTFVGYELAEASNNLNYSMSYNYTNGPFFHTGIKLDYQFTNKFGGMIGVFNRTDTKFDNGPKFVGGQLSYIDGPIKVYLNGLSGKEIDSSSVTTLDLTASYQATSKLGLGFNLLNKSVSPQEGTAANWLGTAFYANYAFTDKFTLAVRGEYLTDSKGLIFKDENMNPILDNNVTAFTISGNFKADALTIIPEIRFDTAKKNIFSDDLGKTKNGETSFNLAAVYKF